MGKIIALVAILVLVIVAKVVPFWRDCFGNWNDNDFGNRIEL